jgi:hypothetical protein
MSVILNFSKWKKVFEATPAEPAAAEYKQVSSSMVGADLATGQATPIPGYTVIGQMGGVDQASEAMLKAGGAVIMKNPVIFTYPNKKGGVAYGENAYRSQQDSAPIDSGKIVIVNFLFEPTDTGQTKITKVVTADKNITAYGFIATMLSSMGLETANDENMATLYAPRIKKVSSALASNLPNLPTSINKYKEEAVKQKDAWKNNLTLALQQKGIFGGDSGQISKFIGANTGALIKVFS